MLKLNLPSYEFRFKKEKDKLKIFDAVRKIYVALTPEEWVRQHFIRYLIEEKQVPASLIVIEAGLKINNTTKRFDAVVYDRQRKAKVLMEFKSPEVPITEKTYEQINTYNLFVKAPYVIISNGINHLCYVLTDKGLYKKTSLDQVEKI